MEENNRARADGHDPDGIPSNLAINGHPIHPIVIALPVTLLPAAFFTDIAYLRTRDPFWYRASRLLLGSGLATGLLAAATGLVDFLTISKVRSHKAGWVHFLGNVAALALTAVNLRRRASRPAGSIPRGGWVLSGLAFLQLIVTGWYGGELVYRHRIAVAGHTGRTGPERGRGEGQAPESRGK